MNDDPEQVNEEDTPAQPDPHPTPQPAPEARGYRVSFGTLFVGSESGEGAGTQQFRLGSIWDIPPHSQRPAPSQAKPTRHQRLTALEKEIEEQAETLEELLLEYDFHMAMCWHPYQKRLVEKGYKPTIEGLEKELADLRSKYHAALEEMEESPEQAALRDGEAMRQLALLDKKEG